MSKKSTPKIADDAPVTQADIDSGRLEYFKAKAGGRGYQIPICAAPHNRPCMALGSQHPGA